MQRIGKYRITLQIDESPIEVNKLAILSGIKNDVNPDYCKKAKRLRGGLKIATANAWKLKPLEIAAKPSGEVRFNFLRSLDFEPQGPTSSFLALQGYWQRNRKELAFAADFRRVF